MNYNLYWLIIQLLLIPFCLGGQNINDYKILLKGNVSDIIFMGRVTSEIEVPIFKNTSLTTNLGLQYKEYFYDKHEGTFTNAGMFRATPQIFPTKNVIGWNAGLGIRQYYRLLPTRTPSSFIEIKGYFRKSRFNENFEVFYDEGSGNGGVKNNHVSGEQQLYSWYFAIGRTSLFENNKISVDLSGGITKNFVKLDTCQDGCSYPDWLAQLIGTNRNDLDSWSASIVGDYLPRESFLRYRIEIKVTFLKPQKDKKNI